MPSASEIGVDPKKKVLSRQRSRKERVQNLRREYWTIIREVNLLNLIFIDETRVNLAMTPSYGRAKKGRRAYKKCPYNRGRNINLIRAISRSKFLASLTFEGWTDKNAFFTYVQKILVPQLWSGACVIMDNLPAHKATQVREAIESLGARVVFLSPYFQKREVGGGCRLI